MPDWQLGMRVGFLFALRQTVPSLSSLYAPLLALAPSAALTAAVDAVRAAAATELAKTAHSTGHAGGATGKGAARGHRGRDGGDMNDDHEAAAERRAMLATTDALVAEFAHRATPLTVSVGEQVW